MAINSIVAAFSGLVAYKDGSSGSFTTSLASFDMGTDWPVEVVAARSDEDKIHAGNLLIGHPESMHSLIGELPFVPMFYAMAKSYDKRQIVESKVTTSFRMSVTFQDRSLYTASASFERGKRISHSEFPDKLSSREDDLYEVLDRLEKMFDLLFNVKLFDETE